MAGNTGSGDTSDADAHAPTAPGSTLTPSQELGQELGSMASLLAAVAATGGPAALAPGTLVGGQYRVEGPLGQGGMGVVYLARDTRLDRAVAVKLGTAVSAPALRRLEREALALARLSHPNVVVVYQVGEVDGRVFIAMEHVAGGTARSWLATQPRGWREIVALYAAAGDGLAAAHAAGLIHRDFKPDNVLVGADGRPRVADFGLARAADAVEPSPAPTAGAVTLTTQTGAIVGTPAYMPPEQLAGADVDARADQFAFAAALWEALFGARPFDGTTPAEVKAAIESQPPAADGEPGGRRVPRHIVAALRRALAADRDARWPDVPALLAALRRDPAARRRRAGFVAVALAIGAAGTAAALTLTADAKAPPPCGDLGPSADWSAAQRAALHARYVAAGGAGAGVAFDRLADRIAYQAAAIGRQRVAACTATHVRRTQSATLLDLRTHCLDRRAAEIVGLRAMLDQADPARLDGALPAAYELGDVAACDDVPRLTGQPALPTDPAALAELLALEQRLAAHRAQAAAGQGAAVVELVRADAARADALAAPALGAEARLLLASLESGPDGAAALAALEAAGHLAAVAHDDVLAARAAIDTLGVVTIQLRQLDEAERLRPLAESALVRAGSPPRDELDFRSVVSQLRARQGDLTAARAEIERALTLAQATFSADDPRLANVLSRLALIMRQQGQLEPSLPVLARAEALLTQAYGPDHPHVAAVLTNQGAAQHALGRYGEARAVLSRALAIKERSVGPDHPSLGATLTNLANASLKEGQVADAIALLERARRIAAATIGPRHPGYAQVLSALADARMAQQDGAAAEALLVEVLAIQADAGADRPEVAETLMGLATLRGARRAFAAARADLERARRIVATSDGARSPAMAQVLGRLAEVELAEGQGARARRTFAAAIAIMADALGDQHPDVVEMRRELASFPAPR